MVKFTISKDEIQQIQERYRANNIILTDKQIRKWLKREEVNFNSAYYERISESIEFGSISSDVYKIKECDM